ncbi:endonuclease Uve1 [Schizosaccharomyces pombe]|uniref:UV-damage endonuclease n=1 Tax=Schizosaccharomyces pombe (strain 972 / ATCC 24843) TaxID=284812 RepID=UVE1_SCHPO|nr:endonuclease Uve1 [Schizosaccharomyces pombe]Q10988.1 RecName: Full=UV-damage endonuclease; Short=UVDE [Schizosaccharomyces pombe 972h-]AAC49664.1 UV damage endonuclease UVDE [Schizosaccharomyces pombe]BAA11415.1 UV-endonuclease [Schizosaccharomyces pombe]CAA19577.1 endonuclease Uve1 [Schizosaccharomyces pombe]|eukprot:NP_596165.1 endonuclease Uve1 [Schizosaccharomyces pombe]
MLRLLKRNIQISKRIVFTILKQKAFKGNHPCVPSVCTITYSRFHCLPDTLKSLLPMSSKTTLSMLPQVNIGANSFSAETPVDLKKENETELANISGPHKKSTSTSTRKRARSSKKKATDSVSDKIDESVASYDSSTHLRRSSRSKKPVNYNSSSESESEEQISKATKKVKQKEEEEYVEEVDEKSLKNESSSDEFEPVVPEQLETPISKRRRSRSSAKNLEKESTMNLDDHAPREMFDCLDKPIPWRGRLGYACLNTILRSMKERVFCSRTCRITTIQRDGLESVKQLGTQNVLDLIKLVEWNHNFGIHFMRVSSDLFPFASHAKYGYTLEFAQSHLEEVGKLANKYNHRLTMHPGQYTQIASPREVVVDSAIRDLAYHDEILSRMKLNEQLNKDAVLIIHLGGTFEGKKETLDRFRKNYQRLSDSVKARLVLENDDVSWSVQDLLPLCQELNIPLVLDWHHHNIVPGTLREGSLDLMPLIPTIRETWTRKGITQKQHYSESADPTAISGMKRRAHSDRVFDFPPCDPTMDLMIEAKEKEQAVFELCRRYELQNPPCPLEIMGPEYDQTRDGYYPPGAEKRLTARKRRSRKEEVEEDEK